MNITVREIYDGFAETYEKNRELFDMTKVLASFYGRLHVKKGRLLDLGFEQVIALEAVRECVP